MACHAPIRSIARLHIAIRLTSHLRWRLVTHSALEVVTKRKKAFEDIHAETGKEEYIIDPAIENKQKQRKEGRARAYARAYAPYLSSS